MEYRKEGIALSLKYGLPGLLGYGSMTGYELNKAFDASLGFFWQGQTSQIYRELAGMERSGWLTSRRVVQEDKPNKKLYTITDAGRQALLEWLSDADGAVGDVLHVRSAFLMRLFFAGELPPEHALALLRALAGLGQAASNIAQYGAAVPDAEKNKYWRIVAQFGESYYRSMLDWAGRSIAMLEDSNEHTGD